MSLNYLDLNKDCFVEENGIYIMKDSDLDMHTPIFKYLTDEALEGIIAGKFLIRQRKSFSDLHESGVLDNPFSEVLCPIEMKAPQSLIKYWEDVKERRIKSGNLHASCFTMDSDEKTFFWNMYGDKGVRLETTIGDFIDGIDHAEIDIYIGEIKYSSIEGGVPDYTTYLFLKKNPYVAEQEVRMYFIPKNENLCNTTEIFLDVNISKMLKGIIISPYHTPKEKGKYMRELKGRFPQIANNICHSKIKEKFNN